MVDRPSPPNRVDHFAHLRDAPEGPSNRQDPGLEYEKYRITPDLIERVKERLHRYLDPPKPEKMSPMDFALKLYAYQQAGALGDILIRELRNLMLSQEQDQA